MRGGLPFAALFKVQAEQGDDDAEHEGGEGDQNEGAGVLEEHGGTAVHAGCAAAEGVFVRELKEEEKRCDHYPYSQCENTSSFTSDRIPLDI